MTPRGALGALKRWDVLVGLIVIAVFCFTDVFVHVGDVRSAATAFNTLQASTEILLIACPMTMLIIAGEIDLSVGSVAALSSCVIGLLVSHGVPMWLAAVGGIVAGVLAGTLNALLVTRAGLHSLAVTIGTLALFRGIANGLLGDTPVSSFPTSWLTFGGYANFFGWLPRVYLIVIPVIAVFGFLLHAARVGQFTYAVGLNSQAARYVGIPVRRLKFRLFVATGAMAGLSGLLLTLRTATATPEAAQGLELSVIAAVLFGGVSIFGGIGTLLGAVNGVLFLSLVTVVLRLANVAPNVLTVVTGGLLLLSVIVPAVLSRDRRPRHRGSTPTPTSDLRPLADVARQ